MTNSNHSLSFDRAYIGLWPLCMIHILHFVCRWKRWKAKKVGNPLRSFLWEGHLRSTMAAVAWVIEADWRWDVRCRRVAERNNHAEWKDNGGWRNIRGEGHIWCVTHPWDISLTLIIQMSEIYHTSHLFTSHISNNFQPEEKDQYSLLWNVTTGLNSKMLVSHTHTHKQKHTYPHRDCINRIVFHSHCLTWHLKIQTHV